MNQLYEIAMQYNKPKTIDGLPAILFGSLRKAGFAADKVTLDRDAIRAAVVDGSLWAVRGIGETTMHQVCEWLEGS
jgi:hypothetical protein